MMKRPIPYAGAERPPRKQARPKRSPPLTLEDLLIQELGRIAREMYGLELRREELKRRLAELRGNA
jgi:hypothetical protein